jgi:hypothetical protein
VRLVEEVWTSHRSRTVMRGKETGFVRSILFVILGTTDIERL